MEKREKRREDEVGDKIREADIRVRNGNKKKIRQDKKKNEEKMQKRKNKRRSKRKPASAKRWLG